MLLVVSSNPTVCVCVSCKNPCDQVRDEASESESKLNIPDLTVIVRKSSSILAIRSDPGWQETNLESISVGIRRC